MIEETERGDTTEEDELRDMQKALESGQGFEGGAIGSRYYITEVNGTINRRWRVMERETAGYDVQISMIGYDERIYEAD